MNDQFRTVTAEIGHVMASRVLSDMACLRRNLEVEIIPYHGQELLLSIRSLFLKNTHERIDVEKRWPADWWQAVRERWFPAWWLLRWPVRYESVSIHEDVTTYVCPHLDVKARDPHIAFVCQTQQPFSGDRP